MISYGYKFVVMLKHELTPGVQLVHGQLFLT